MGFNLGNGVEWLKTLKNGDVHHARSTRYGVLVYRLDKTSPSSFILAGTCEDTPETYAILRSLHASPLSPTESV